MQAVGAVLFILLPYHFLAVLEEMAAVVVA
jgi:hypothetical protein